MLSTLIMITLPLTGGMIAKPNTESEATQIAQVIGLFLTLGLPFMGCLATITARLYPNEAVFHDAGPAILQTLPTWAAILTLFLAMFVVFIKMGGEILERNNRVYEPEDGEDE